MGELTAIWKEGHNLQEPYWEYYYRCSNCKKKIKHSEKPENHHYCYNCGAKMMGVKRFKPIIKPII